MGRRVPVVKRKRCLAAPREGDVRVHNGLRQVYTWTTVVSYTGTTLESTDPSAAYDNWRFIHADAGNPWNGEVVVQVLTWVTESIPSP